MAGLFVGACFCAHGLAGAGGVGKVMAEWITEGEPSLDLWEMDIRRFGSQYRSPAYTHARIKETYETYYDILYPNHEREAGRPLRVTPARLAAARRCLRRGRAGSASTGTESNAGGDESPPPGLVGPRGRRRRRRAPGHPRGVAPSTDLLRQDGDRGPKGSRGGRASRQPGGQGGGKAHLHTDVTRSGSSATSRSPVSPKTASRSSPAPPSATTTASGSANTCRRTGASRFTTPPRSGPASGSGAP